MCLWPSISSGLVERGADMVWNREFFDLVLNRWATAYGWMVEPRVMLLFRMNPISLQTNIWHVHRVAQSYLRGEFRSSDSSYLTLQKWRDGDDCGHALWHANEIIRGLHSRRRSPNDDEESRSTYPREGFIEALHIPFCIDLATLTLWTAAMVEQKPDQASAKAHLENGVHNLGYLKVQIAQVLKRAFRRLTKSTDSLSP